MSDNLKEFSNQEKAMVIIALRDKYPVKRILEVFDMAKSSYCYQQKQIKKENKIVSSALGDVPTVHVIGIPSKQSMIGDKYTFPSPILNSVMSVNHFLFGLSA